MVPDPPALGGEVGWVAVAKGVTKLLVTVVMQVTALPPPVAVPLHWFTVTGSADVPPATVQPTAVSPRYAHPPVTGSRCTC